MEFGLICSQAFVPNKRVEREGEAAEHNSIMDDVAVIVEADRRGWKYSWSSEHHFLDEYSHMSASEVFMGYVAALTTNIHLGSGIFNLNPVINHPVRIAERVAMLDHLSDGRFEFGAGRGAGTYEITGFDLADAGDTTRAAWDEVINEMIPMWESTSYRHQSELYKVPHPRSAKPGRNILPKIWKKPHPPLWVAAGSPGTYEKSARMGLGVLGFSLASAKEMAPLVETYKKYIASAEPVGRYINDNVLLVSQIVCCEDGQEAREVVAFKSAMAEKEALGLGYHDTFVRPGAGRAPASVEPLTLEEVNRRIAVGKLICGDPDEVASQLQIYADIGCDQIAFSMPLDVPLPYVLKTLQLVGEHVIPRFDADPIHRTSRLRNEANEADSAP